ncbi:MAG TPA: MFS transporter, partial [Vineibacter sp.]|nr:MFS transporter [Vineibacter sp.]
ARLGATVEQVAPPGIPELSAASRKTLAKLCALFGLDGLGSGFLTTALLSYYFFERYGVSEALIGALFFGARLMNAASHLAAAKLASRIGLVNTMVFTHLPANLFLMLAPFAPSLEIALALLFLRSALSSMDVAPRTALVLSLVPPAERAAATSVTAVPRALAAAGAPIIAGWLLASSPFGWAVVVGGGLKAGYDVLLLLAGRRLARERGAGDVT